MRLPVDLRAEDLRLRAELMGRRLICEVSLDRTEFEGLRDEILSEPDNAWQFPYVAAVVTVGIGIYSYESGDYWDAFPQIEVGHRQRWGENFERFLATHPTLETFGFLREERAHRFVAPILGHGGVPCSCLDDLFSALMSNCCADQSGTEALDCLSTDSRMLTGVSQPARRFITYGGEVAEDLISRLLALWDARENNDSDATFGLPIHILEAFDAWFPNALHGGRQTRQRFPSPTIQLDPGTMAITLRLPRCDSVRGAGQTWRSLDTEWPSDRDSSVALRKPAPGWRVECGRRSFEFPGLSATSRYLLFDPPTGLLIREPAKRRLPVQVWALHDVAVKTDPPPVHQEDFLPWQGVVFSVFDLTGMAHLSVGERLFEVRRPFFSISDEVGLVESATGPGGVPVLSSSPRIFWEGTANLDLTLNGSHLGNIDLRCEELPTLLSEPGDCTLFLRGPLGQNLAYRYLLVPGLSVSACPRTKLPGQEVTEWKVKAPSALFAWGEERGTTFRTSLPALDLEVEYPSLGSRPALRLHLRCEVPRLEWCVSVVSADSQLRWTSEPALIGMPELSKSMTPLLACRLPAGLQDCDVALVTDSGQTIRPRAWRFRQERLSRFDLREARDLVLATGAPQRLNLVVFSNGRTIFHGRALEVRPDWDLREITASWSRRQDLQILRVQWVESGVAVTGRWIEILPAWRPWDQCILRRELAPTETGLVELRLRKDDLPPGRYAIRAIHAPWGLEDLKSIKQQEQRLVDVYPEIWPDVFSQRQKAGSVASYLETLLAHWHNHERVRCPPSPPSGLSPTEVLWFLDGYERATSIERPRIPRDGSGSLNIFLANPHATATAVSGIATLPQCWLAIMPSIEIITLVPNDADRRFLVDLVLNDLGLGDHHFRGALSQPLKEWHMGVCGSSRRNASQPRVDEVLFLCERFEILRDRSADSQAIYAELKAKYMSREAV